MVDLKWAEAKEITSGNLPSVMKSNSYRPILLISDTAQLALSHHLDDEINKKLSVGINTQAASPQAPTMVSISGKSTPIDDFKAYRELG